MRATVRRRHEIPAGAGPWIVRQSRLQHRREFTLGFHDLQKALCHLIGTPKARLSRLAFRNKSGDRIASGMVQRLIEPGELLRLAQDALPLRGWLDFAWRCVRLHAESGF